MAVRTPRGPLAEPVTTGSLLLFPYDARAEPPTAAAVVEALAALGLIGDLLPAGDAFRTGPEFLQHVTFLGCAPHLVLDPPADGGTAFSHVVVAGPFDVPRLVVGTNGAAPRCPECRARFEGWRDSLAGWVRAPLVEGVRCPGCGARLAPVDLDWRERAAVGRLFVEIRNVFPGEAVPGEGLLNALWRLGKRPWRHAWVSGLPATW